MDVEQALALWTLGFQIEAFGAVQYSLVPSDLRVEVGVTAPTKRQDESRFSFYELAATAAATDALLKLNSLCNT